MTDSPRDAEETLGTQEASGRLRGSSIANAATKALIDFNPQRGMWGATGNAIAHAPNLTDLRSPDLGGENIIFDTHGHSAREVPPQDLKRAYLSKRQTDENVALYGTNNDDDYTTQATDLETSASAKKLPWNQAVLHGLAAFGKFFITPTGFIMTLYGLNVVAWGAMLFFLLLHAAPAMDHPDNGDAVGAPRRVWIEIDSQILNALFCLTAWGLAPWRFRDLWWVAEWRFARDRAVSRRAIHRLAARNESWFRLSESDYDDCDDIGVELTRKSTFSGIVAPPTDSWKMDFVVWMFVLNTLFQVGMAFMMWNYNYVDRPTWGAGLFIALGCVVSMFAGIMCWWEGRRIKIIEGPKILSDKT